jgi:hypothetical protein
VRLLVRRWRRRQRQRSRLPRRLSLPAPCA